MSNYSNQFLAKYIGINCHEGLFLCFVADYGLYFATMCHNAVSLIHIRHLHKNADKKQSHIILIFAQLI